MGAISKSVFESGSSFRRAMIVPLMKRTIRTRETVDADLLHVD